MAMLCAGALSAQSYDASFNTEEATSISITAAGKYLVYNEFFSATAVPIQIAADIADTVFVSLQDVNIKPESEGSAMIIGKNTTVVVMLEGDENVLQGKSKGCGIEAVGNVIIRGKNNDVILTCKGSGNAAGIGSTNKSDYAGDIIIESGSITSQGGSESAGIGAANGGRLGNITINGGFVTAKGGAYSSGIGASYVSKNASSGVAVTLAFHGGTISARSGYYCSNRSVGKGNGTHSGTIKVLIDGGSLLALNEKGENSGVIEPTPNNGSYDVEYFKFTLEGEEGQLVTSGHAGDIQLGSDYGIKDVYIDENGELHFWLPEDVHQKEVVINGVTVQKGGGGGGGDTDSYHIDTDKATYIQINKDTTYTIFSSTGSQSSVPVKVDGHLPNPVTIIMKGVDIKARMGSAMIVGDSTTVVLKLDSAESALEGSTKGCGIEVLGTLIIESSSDTMKLTCKGDGACPGIGTTDSSAVAGDIIINSGYIISKNGGECAGIGAAKGGKMPNVTINGGRVEATGGSYASGIGASYISKGSATIEINGGTITSRSGYYSSNNSLGKGNGTHSGTITTIIRGGSILALNEKGEEGGVLKPTPSDMNEEVKLYKYKVSGEEESLVTEGHVKCCVLGKDYGIKSVYTNEEGYVYFYLPESVAANAEVVINSVKVQSGDACQSALDGVSEQPFEVIKTARGIILRHTDGAKVTVVSALGTVLFSAEKMDDQLIELPNGMFLVSVANHGTMKITH